MRARYFVIALLTVGFTSSASAQDINLGELGGEILGLIGTLTGIRVDDPTTALGIAAVLGVMTILVYLPIKLGAKRLDIEDSVLGTEGSRTSSGSRNLAAILSVLITLSTIPTGFFELLITGYGTLSVLIGLLMLVLVTYATIKFFGTGVSGIGSVSSAVGQGLEADAKEAQASNLDAEAEALEKENQARERYKSAVQDLEEIEDEVEGAEAEAEDGGESGSGEEEQEAVERIRNALDALKSESKGALDELEKDKEMLDEAIKDAKKELSLENDIDEGIIDLHKRIQRVKIYLEESEGILANQFSGPNPPQWLNLITGFGDYQDIQDEMDSKGVLFEPSNTNSENALKDTPGVTGDNYGLYEVIADLERAEEEIQLIEKELYPEADKSVDLSGSSDFEDEKLAEEFMELLYATESATDFSQVLTEMKEVLREVHAADEEIEEICSEYDWNQLYDAADENESIESQLMNRINKLSDTESELNNKIEEAHELLKKQVLGTDEIIDELERLSGDTGGTFTSGENPLNEFAVDLRTAATDNDDGLTVTGGGERLVDTSPTAGWDASADGFGFTVDISSDSYVELATPGGDGLLGKIVQDTREIKDPLVGIAHEVNQEDHEEHDILEEIEAHLNSG